MNMKKQRGFTLIELIIALIAVPLMLGALGFAIFVMVTFVKIMLRFW